MLQPPNLSIVKVLDTIATTRVALALRTGGGRTWRRRGDNHNGVTISALTGVLGKRHTMRIFAYLGFLIVWLLAPAPMAITMADSPVQAVAPEGTQPPQPPEEDLLNLLD